MRLLDIKEVQKLQLDLMKIVHDFLQKNDIKYYLVAGSALGAVRHQGFIPWDDDIDIAIYRDDYEKFIKLSKHFDPKYEVVNFLNKNNCGFTLTRIYIPNTYIDLPSIKKTKLDKRLYFDIFPLDNVPEDEKERAQYEIKIRKKKNLLARVDVRNYNNKKYQLAIKKLVSLVLTPFRKNIFRSIDKLFKKYRYTETQWTCSLSGMYPFKNEAMLKSIYGKPVLQKFEDTMLYIPEKWDIYLRTVYGDDYMEVPPVEKRRKSMVVYSLEEE